MKLSRILALGAAALAIATTAASAQDYYGGTQENVIVIAPRELPQGFSKTQRVSLSQEVRYDDLDLTTRSGVHELRYRVRETARDICRDLWYDSKTVETTPDSCISNATQSGLRDADQAVRHARHYAYNNAAYYDNDGYDGGDGYDQDDGY